MYSSLNGMPLCDTYGCGYVTSHPCIHTLKNNPVRQLLLGAATEACRPSTRQQECPRVSDALVAQKPL